MVTLRRDRFGSIRFRVTVVATVVVAIVLTASGVALLFLQRVQLTANLDASLAQRADLIAVQVATDVGAVSADGSDEDRSVQLVSLDGAVLAATANLSAAGPLANPLPPGVDQVIATRDDVPLEEESYRVLSRRVDTLAGAAILHVVQDGEGIDDTVGALAAALGIGVPAVGAVLAVLIWWLTGRTLRPVEVLRTQVEDITASESPHRLDVPARDDEITRLATTLNRMLDRLSDAADRQRRFVADVAHELRTPLTRIRTEVEVDLAQPGSADPTATNRAVRDDVMALQELIDDLLHLARSDVDPSGTQRRTVDLDDIVLREIRGQREVDPSIRIDAQHVSAASLVAHPDHLARAVRNLLDNAVRHAVGTVTVSLTQHDGHVELTVADDGPGIPGDQQERIFERFSRLDDARTRHDGGTGLGLAITRDIVERHGGTVRYDAEWTSGARFVVVLPRLASSP